MEDVPDYINNPNSVKHIASVYPNPSTGRELNIKLSNISSSESVHLVLYNSTGKPVWDKTSAGSGEISLDKHLSPGVYLLYAKSKSNTHTQKVVIY